MLATANLVLLALEAALYLGLGHWLVSRHALGALPVALAMVGLALLVRLALVARGFALARRLSTEDAATWRLGAGGWLRLVGGEWLATIALWVFLHPLERLVNRRDPPPDAPGPPVVLVHGLACNGASWLWLKRRLAACGFPRLYTINLEPPLGDIDDYGAQLARRVDDIMRGGHAVRVLLVGHSMGGLVARVYLHRHGGAARVAGLVTLGTPHHGTGLARRALATNVRQMQLDSSWLEELNRTESGPAPVPFLSIWSAHDNIVSPQAGARVAHAENVRLSGIGHVAMFFSPRVEELVCGFLQRAAAGRRIAGEIADPAPRPKA